MAASQSARLPGGDQGNAGALGDDRRRDGRNFTKLLVGRDGAVIKRYEPPVSPDDIKADLENYL